MKKSRILKLSTLIDLGACPDQVELFRKTFGESVRVTEKLCLSVSDKFAWTWAASYLLSAQRRVEYSRVTGLAWDKCTRAMELARAGRESRRLLPRAEYVRTAALAFARGYLS
jgi:hypothetical protein